MVALKRVAGLLAALLLQQGQAAWAQQSPAELKAQVLVKVLRFVEWPAAQLAEGQALQLCLLDDGELAQRLLPLDGQAVGARPLRVRSQRTRALGGCHVALLGAAAPGAGAGILLVGEEGLQPDRGLMLSLLIEDGRVVFDIDLDAARRAGIEFSARLLRLARYVRRT